MKKKHLFMISFSLLSVSLPSFIPLCQAETLLQVYQKARQNNPVLRGAIATRDGTREAVTVARSAFLPQIGISTAYAWGNNNNKYSNETSANWSPLQLGVNQTLFDLSQWHNLTISEKQAHQADIQFALDEQTLLSKTIDNYFNVLKALDALKHASAQEKHLARQVDMATHRVNVGSAAIDEKMKAVAQHMGAKAERVKASHNLRNSLEGLRTISGVYYTHLADINVKKLHIQPPLQANKAIEIAKQKSLLLSKARLQQVIARENIKAKQMGHAPTINANAGIALLNFENNSVVNKNLDNKFNISVTFNLPIYSGGKVMSQVKQSQYEFVAASEKLEEIQRQVTQKVRSSANEITANMQIMKAYQASESAAAAALKAAEERYKVGTNTIVDILNSTSVLYEAKKNLSGARYDYLKQGLVLKAEMGILSEQDLATLDAILTKPVSTQLESTL